MIKIKTLSAFKKDYKKYYNNKKVRNILYEILQKLCNNNILDVKYKRHPLKGGYISFESLHIFPDLILIFKIEDNILKLYRIGSHAEIYK